MARSLSDVYVNVQPTRHLVARGGILTTSAQAMKIALILISQIAIARLLTPEDFGVVAMVTPVLGLLQVIADLGVPQIIVQTSQLHYGELNALYWRNLRNGVLLTGLCVLASPAMSFLYREPRVLAVALVLSSMVLLSSMAAPLNALLGRNMRYGVQSLADIVGIVSFAIVGIGSAYFGFSYWSIVFAQLAMSLSTLSILLYVSDWYPTLTRERWDIEHLRRASGNVTVANVASYLNATLANVIVGAVLGKAALGIYDRAWKFAVQPLSAATIPIGRVAIPTLSRIFGETERYRKATSKFLQLLLLIVLPIAMSTLVLSAPLVEIFLGTKWASLVPVLSWVSFGALITPLNTIVFWSFVSQGRTSEQMRWGTTAAAINLTSYAIGLPWGIQGVAAVSAISTWLIQMPMLMWALSRSGPVTYREILPTVRPFVVAGAVQAGVLMVIASNFAITTLFELIAAGVLGVIAFLAAVCAFSSGRVIFVEMATLTRGLARGR